MHTKKFIGFIATLTVAATFGISAAHAGAKIGFGGYHVNHPPDLVGLPYGWDIAHGCVSFGQPLINQQMVDWAVKYHKDLEVDWQPQVQTAQGVVPVNLATIEIQCGEYIKSAAVQARDAKLPLTVYLWPGADSNNFCYGGQGSEAVKHATRYVKGVFEQVGATNVTLVEMPFTVGSPETIPFMAQYLLDPANTQDVAVMFANWDAHTPAKELANPAIATLAGLCPKARIHISWCGTTGTLEYKSSWLAQFNTDVLQTNQRIVSAAIYSENGYDILDCLKGFLPAGQTQITVPATSVTPVTVGGIVINNGATATSPVNVTVGQQTNVNQTVDNTATGGNANANTGNGNTSNQNSGGSGQQSGTTPPPAGGQNPPPPQGQGGK